MGALSKREEGGLDMTNQLAEMLDYGLCPVSFAEDEEQGLRPEVRRVAEEAYRLNGWSHPIPEDILD